MSAFILQSTNLKCILLLILIALVVSISGRTYDMRGSSVRKSCGRDLVERVDRICQSRGGHMTHTSVRAHRRVRRGIVHECCFNKCADQHIHAYCSNDEEVKSSETNSVSSSHENPIDLDVAEISGRSPEAQALVRSVDAGNVIEANVDETTVKPIETTTEFNSVFLEKKLKSLPFQVGTVPPEYRIFPFAPSYSRLMN